MENNNNLSCCNGDGFGSLVGSSQEDDFFTYLNQLIESDDTTDILTSSMLNGGSSKLNKDPLFCFGTKSMEEFDQYVEYEANGGTSAQVFGASLSAENDMCIDSFKDVESPSLSALSPQFSTFDSDSVCSFSQLTSTAVDFSILSSTNSDIFLPTTSFSSQSCTNLSCSHGDPSIAISDYSNASPSDTVCQLSDSSFKKAGIIIFFFYGAAFDYQSNLQHNKNSDLTLTFFLVVNSNI